MLPFESVHKSVSIEIKACEQFLVDPVCLGFFKYIVCKINFLFLFAFILVVFEMKELIIAMDSRFRLLNVTP